LLAIYPVNSAAELVVLRTEFSSLHKLRSKCIYFMTKFGLQKKKIRKSPPSPALHVYNEK
jgi:hypothetical protein